MRPIEPPDSHRILAASGWLELGCPGEALAEIQSLSEPNRHHPDALELDWLIHAKLGHWPNALAAANALVEIAPDRPAGWLHRAYATRRVPGGGIERAWELLLPAFERFPKETLIPYNLSCYACQMGRLDESRKWLSLALRMGDPKSIKRMALQDDDLRNLWNEIPNL